MLPKGQASKIAQMASGMSRRRNAALMAFELGVILPTLAGGVFLDPGSVAVQAELVIWSSSSPSPTCFPSPHGGPAGQPRVPPAHDGRHLYAPAIAAVMALLGRPIRASTSARFPSSTLSSIAARWLFRSSRPAPSITPSRVTGSSQRLQGSARCDGGIRCRLLRELGIVTIYVSIKTGLAPRRSSGSFESVV